MTLAQKDVDSLVKLAERERAGDAVAERQIAKALESVCRKEVTKLMLSRKLAPIDSELILIIEHWLEVYGIELEMVIKSESIKYKLTTLISMGVLGIASILFFLTDLEFIESSSGDQKILILLAAFVIFAVLRIRYRAKMDNAWKMHEFSKKMQASIKENILVKKKGDGDV